MNAAEGRRARAILGRGRRMSANLPLVVGMSGVAGVIYGVGVLEIVRDLDIPSPLVTSHSAEVTLAHDTDRKVAAVRALATGRYAQADLGAVIAPPVPAFYARPGSIAEKVNHTVGQVLDLFDIDTAGIRRWKGEERPAS